MWLREWCLSGMQNGEFWLIVLVVFLTQLYLVAAVEHDRIRGVLPQRASELYILTLVLPFLSIWFLAVRPFREPFSYVVGFLLAFTVPTVIFARTPGHYGFRKPLVWLSRFLALGYSILLVIFSAVIPR